MRCQGDLLREPWRVLLILDAARADIAHEVDSRFETVEWLGGITRHWCRALWQNILPDTEMHYFTANPEPTLEWCELGRPAHVRMHNIWTDENEGWRNFTKHKLGTVPPANVVRYLRRWLDKHGQPDRVVIHFIQPHQPYTRKPLPTQTGNIVHGPTPRNKVDTADGVKAGLYTWKDVRESYRDSLAWGLAHALELEKMLTGPVIITSDHGEALGEGGIFGHGGRVPRTILAPVPWLALPGKQKREC